MKAIITVTNSQGHQFDRYESVDPRATDLVVRALRFLHPDCDVDTEFETEGQGA